MSASSPSFARWPRKCPIIRSGASRRPEPPIHEFPVHDIFPTMPFRRFFDRGAKDAPKVETPPPDASDDIDDAESAGDPEQDVEAEHPEWGARALGVLPTGASTGSKR